MKKILFYLIPSLLLWPAFSYADWGHHDHAHAHAYYRYHDHPHYGYRVRHFYPNEYFSVWVGRARYYYDDGVYYNYIDGNYEVVQPPVGAVVGDIPTDFQPVVINGTTYYTNSGIYYVSTPHGYEVVTPPAPAPVHQGSFVVNVPSNRGGYVAVTIRRAGDGYVGPQGEFYANFPAISQLRIMYGK